MECQCGNAWAIPTEITYPYLMEKVRTNVKVVAARVTTKGQITLPIEMRRSLHIRAGDTVLFRVDEEEQTARVSRIPRWEDLAGSVPIPEDKKDWTWDEITEYAWRKAAERHL
jgi:AbrB family looped-hinge helix DNA binding protein